MSAQPQSGPLPLAGVRVIDYSHFLAGPHLSRCLAAMRRPAPLMGQHNRTIAADLGLTAQGIAALQADGVLYAEEAVATLNEKPVA